MKTTLIQLLLGLIVLPMTCFPSLKGESLPVRDGVVSNHSDNPDDFSEIAPAALMDFTVTASSATVVQGETFCVSVSVSNFTDILGVEFFLDYDPALLQFTEVNNLNLAGLTTSSFGKPGDGNNQPGALKLSWFDQTVSGVSVADGTAIFDVCFTALATDATASLDFSGAEIIDLSESIIPFTGVSGTVTIGSGGSTGGSTGGGDTGTGSAGDFTITVEDVSVSQGESFCVAVSVANFTDILGVEAVFNYDASLLQYTGVQSFNLSGLITSSFGEPGVGANPMGELKLSWFDQTVSGITVADGTVIFEICFTALASDATDNIFISNDEVIDINENILPYVGQTGTITIGSGGDGGGGSTGSSEDFTVTVGDASVSQGQEVCVPVTVSNFTDILGVELVFNYDPARLSYTGVQNLNLAGLTESSFGQPGVGANPEGQLKLSWFDQTVSGVTTTDGTVIFEICFTSLASTGSTDITFSSNEIIDISESILPFNGVTGTITQGATTGGSDNPQLIAANATVDPNDMFCVGISANNFTDLSGMEFTLSYDPALLEFTEVSNLNLTGLSTSSFGLPGVGANPLGAIKVSWFDMGGTGVSVADGTSLFEACFTPKVAGTSTSLNFTGVELIDNNSNVATATTTAGTVTINQGMVATDDFTLKVGSASVAAGELVCIPLTVYNFDNILGMEFNIDYDPSVLRFTEVTDFNLKDLSASVFGLPGVGANLDGTIKLSWFDQAAAGVTVADGTAIFMMCFETIGTGNTMVEVRSSGLEVIDGNENPVPAVLQDGIIAITGVIPTTDLQFIVGSAMVSPSGNVCLPVSVNNFDNVVGMEFVMTYDPSVLQFEEVQNLNLTGLATSSFGLPGVGVNPEGEIKVSWFDPEVQGVTVADGTVLFELCFSALAESGSANVGINTGFPIEIIDNNEELVPYQLNAGVISIVNFGFTRPATVTQVVCSGQSTGAIDIDVAGGSGSYSYTWSNDATTEDLANLAAGTYSVTVTDLITGGTAMESFLITQPATPINVQANMVEETCVGIDDGSISLIVSGGGGSYSYTWGNGLTGNVATQTNLTAGEYPVTITDNNTCALDTVIELMSVDAIVISNLEITYLEGGNPGAVQMDLSGGGLPYTMQWTGPNGFTATTEDITGLTDIGDYCFSVSNTNGCVTDLCVMMNEQLALSDFSIENTCFGQATGSVDLTVTGGMAPYTFTWNNGATTEDLTDVMAGNYMVTVTDAQNQSFNSAFPVNNFAPIFTTSMVMDVTGDAANNNGSIMLEVVGGNDNYTFNWNNGATTSTIENLSEGEYCVTITGLDGCTLEECYKIDVVVLPLSFSGTSTSTSCNGSTDGSADIQIIGGSAPYVISFADGIRLSTTNGMISRDNLPAGALNFIITDATNTTLAGSVLIEQPAAITATSVTVVHDADATGCTGEISLELTGGTPGYNVFWNSPNTGSHIIGLCEGNYVATVRDATGCLATLDPIFVNTFSLDKEIQPVECMGDENGSITILPQGGSGPYVYTWADASGQVIAEEATLEGVAAGAYTITVSESSGNTIVETITLGVSSTLTATTTVETDYRGFGASCLDATDATVSVAAANGSGTLMYTWLDEANNIVGDMARLEQVAPGAYRVEVMDQTGCTITEEVQITAPEPVAVNAFITDLSCRDRRDGGITVAASGGTGSLSYRWSNQATTPTINLLVDGPYTLTVTDANACETVNTFTVSEPAPIEVVIETTPASDGCNGAATAMVSGGTGPYEYRWNTNAVSADSVITDLCPGDYQVAVVDAKGCESDPVVTEAAVLDRRFPCMDMRTVISPNGDGENDNFLINCIELTNDNRLLIFNQWGQLVYEAENYDNEWRGISLSGEALPEGAYYFIFEFTDNEGNFVQEKGSITLLLKE